MGESAVYPAREPDSDWLLELLPMLRRRASWLARQHRIPAEDADDVVQQALLALVVKYDEIRSPEAWLLGTVRNKCRRYWRLRRARPVDCLEPEALEEVMPVTGPAQDRDALRHDLERLLEAVPGRCREILRYRYALGMRATEIGEMLGCPASTVRQISTRCLRGLRRALASAPVGGKGG